MGIGVECWECESYKTGYKNSLLCINHIKTHKTVSR